MAFWATYCADYSVNGEEYGRPLPDTREARVIQVQEEMVALACFAGYVVMYPRRNNKTHNSVVHVEWAVGIVKAYYRGNTGRTPGSGVDANFDSYVKDALRVLGKVYPSEVMKRAPLLADNMRRIKAKIDLQDAKEATL